ncbi:GDP-mannose 4,6-dehydratase [Micromonospora sp. MED01]|uniref:GDP-mannose 4,6-dehydratase n=1 Tax=Micromonospora alfalfae TaxID=2911212 RepID=UPI001EE811E4|nr:GDP-mannose 4,6-dehydratase [Micromonospora alfalfae]MCG5461595.1 GDP-mannose 4,6-dehydratase [Micromonospora alfalfae]
MREILQAGGTPESSAPGEPSVEPARVTVLTKLADSGSLRNLETVGEDTRPDLVHCGVDTALIDAVAAGHVVIVRFAADSHVDRSIAGATPFVTTNALGTQTLPDAAPRHETPGRPGQDRASRRPQGPTTVAIPAIPARS